MVQLDGSDLLGRPVKIKPGVAKSGERTNGGGDQSRSLFGQDRWRRPENATSVKPSSEASQRVYVGGLPRLTDQEALLGNIQTFFQGYHVYVSFPFLLPICPSPVRICQSQLTYN